MLGAVLPAQDPTVGERGSLAHVVVVGAEAIGRDRFLAAVAAAPAAALAGRPDAPRAAWLQFLQQRALQCLRANGYLQAEVAVTWDAAADAPRLELQPGEPFVIGPIRCDGNTAVTTADLVAAVGDRWRTGAPLRLSAGFAAEVVGALQQVYSAAGHLAAAARVEVTPLADGSAELRITVAEEGPCFAVAAVAVVGESADAERDAVAERLRFIVDQPWTRAMRERVRAALEGLGRYHVIQLDDRARAGDRIAPLTVRVAPATFGLSLLQPSPPPLALLRRGRDWLAPALAGSHCVRVDWHAGATDGTADLAVRGAATAWLSGQGLLLHLAQLMVAGEPMGELWLWGDASGVGVCLPGAGVRAGFDVPLQTQAILRAEPTSADAVELRWGFGLRTRRAGAAAVAFDVAIADLALVKLLADGDLGVRSDAAGVLLTRGEQLELRVDAATGEVGLVGRSDVGAGRVVVTLVPLVLAQRLRELSADWNEAGVATVDIGELMLRLGPADLASTVGRLLPEAEAADLARAWPLLRSLLAAGPALWRRQSEPGFRPPEHGLRATWGDTVLEWLAAPAALGSWPELLARTQARLRGGPQEDEARATLREFAAAWSADTPGPLGHWLAAETFAARRLPQVMRAVARDGVRDGVLGWPACAADLAALAPPGSPLAEALAAVGGRWRADPQVLPLLGKLPEAATERDAAEAGLRVLWQGVLRGVLAARLQALGR